MAHVTDGLGPFDETPDQPWPIAAYLDFYGPSDLSIGNQEPTACDHEGAARPEGRLLGGALAASWTEGLADIIDRFLCQAWDRPGAS